MKSIAKIFIVTLCILALFVVLSVALTIFYRNDILKAVLAAAAQNNELYFSSTDVDVVLSMNLKNTALVFTNVDVSSKSSDLSGAKFGLLAETLRVEVDLLHFALRKEVKIKKLTMSNGQLKLRLAQSKKDTPAAAPRMPNTEDLLRGVSRVQLERCALSVENISGSSVSVDIEALGASVEKSAEALSLHVKGLLAVQLPGSRKPAQRTRASLSVDARCSLAQGVATIAGSKLSVDGVALEAEGRVAFRPLGELELSIAGKNLSLKNLVEQAQRYVEFSAPERLSGRADVNVRLAGSLKEKSTLSLVGRGAVRGATLTLKDAETVNARELRCVISSRDVKNPEVYTCVISSDEVSYRSFRIGGEGEVSNFKAPLYDLNITFLGDAASLNMASLPEGKMKGQARGRTKGLSSEDIEEISLQASVADLKALLHGEVYTVNGEFVAAKDGVFLTRLSIAGEAVEGVFDGAVLGYPPALLDNSQAALKIRGDLNARRLNLDKLFLQGDSTLSGRDIYAKLNVRADESTLLGYAYRNVSGTVDYSPRRLIVNDLKTGAFDGALGGDVKLYTPADGSSRLSCDLYFNGVSMVRLPYLSKNFGVKPGSMQGLCSGSITLAGDVGKEGLDMSSLSATVDFTVSNGRLLGFEPIQPLSAYLKKSLLQDVRFSTLKNTLSLEKGKIIIPKMEVRSTALNILIAGEQELKGDFDYHLTLYLSELLSGKEKNIDNPIKEDKTKLFLRFTSKNGVTEVAHDGREWSKNLGKKMQREAQAMKSLLRAEQETGKNLPSAAQEKEKITVEWEEDSDVAATEKAAKRAEQKSTPKPEKAAPKKQQSAVEVEWEE
jgi:fibronectin type 3 domain-containing protein